MEAQHLNVPSISKDKICCYEARLVLVSGSDLNQNVLDELNGRGMILENDTGYEELFHINVARDYLNDKWIKEQEVNETTAIRCRELAQALIDLDADYFQFC